MTDPFDHDLPLDADAASIQPQPSLDDLRPRTLAQMPGNAAVRQLLSRQMHSGNVPQRILFHGPSGAGKTTFSHILAAHRYCLNRTGIGDPCRRCVMCKKGLSVIMDFQEFTGADLEDQWKWWLARRSMLAMPSITFFLDEAQGLSRERQRVWHRDLETARGMVIFATTHLFDIDDALVNRFYPNVYELQRPSPEETVDYLAPLYQSLGVSVEREHLTRIAISYACDMRKCVNFGHNAARQLPGPDKAITHDYLDLFLGALPSQSHANPQKGQRRLPKL
jgi:replication-associated recombination protein RarA